MRCRWLVRNPAPSHPGRQPRSFAEAAWWRENPGRPLLSPLCSVTACLQDGRHWGDVSEGRAKQGKKNNDHTSHRNRPHFFFFYCVVFTLDSNMLVQSMAGKTSMDPLTGFPSPPCTWLLLIPLRDPSAEAVIKEHFGCKQWAAYNTWMGWERCPPRTWNPHKWLERQDASSVANRMMEFKTHNWFLFSFWIPGVYWNQLFYPYFICVITSLTWFPPCLLAYIFEWCTLKFIHTDIGWSLQISALKEKLGWLYMKTTTITLHSTSLVNLGIVRHYLKWERTQVPQENNPNNRTKPNFSIHHWKTKPNFSNTFH